jgi:hypothetical protein
MSLLVVLTAVVSLWWLISRLPRTMSASSALAGRRAQKAMAIRKKASQRTDDLRSEYDFAELGKGVRGKYYRAAVAGSNLVLLDPDVAKAFPTPEAVNNALRLLAGVATEASRPSRKRRGGGG